MKLNFFPKTFLLFLTALICSVTAHAQLPPAEQLLPDNVMLVGTIHDWKKAEAYLNQTPTSMFWNDTSMKPFRDNFLSKLNEEVFVPLEKELGIKLADYRELLQGQLTFAVTPPTDTKGSFGVILLLDAKDKSDLLKTRLSEIQKKWRDSGKQIKSEKIRDVEFSTLIISKKDVENLMSKAFPSFVNAEEEGETDEDKPAEEEKETSNDNVNLHIGQSKSLLIIGNQPALIEKVVARQTGGLVSPLSETPAFQKNYPAFFRDSVGYGWIRIAPIYDLAMKSAAAESQIPEGEAGNPMAALKSEKILPALGLKSLESIGFTFSGNAEGDRASLFVAVPEAQREGLFKVFTLEKKEATPPAFVPADAVKFSRVRLDLKKTWASLQQMVGNIDPNFSAIIQFGISTLNTVGKEKDPNFDFTQTIIGNFGDDIITYEKAPKEATAEALQSPPEITLISSPQATQLLDALRGLVVLLPQGGEESLKETEFLGRKIYSYGIPVPEGVTVPGGAPFIYFTASGGYVAVSSDRSMVEEYLRSGDAGPKPLRAVEGFAENVQKVGGGNNGFFGYENQTETIRTTFEVLKKDKNALTKMFEATPVPGAEAEERSEEGILSWFDTTLLPNYDAVAKYFGPAAYSINPTAEGYKVEFFSPRPAELNK